MSWRIQTISNPPQFDDEVKTFAKEHALAEALKQAVDFNDVAPDCIDRLGQKWRDHCLGIRRMIGNCSNEQFDHLLVLAWRVNRFAHHYEAALISRTLELSGKEPSELEKELSTAKGCQKHYECGVLIAQHYTTIIGTKEMLQGTCLTSFPGTGIILKALSFDCAMQAALCLPDNIEKALDWLADSVAANDLALQGMLQVSNFFNRKAERATNGKAGAQIRHAKTRELKEWTLQKYKAKTWKSANQAASELMSEVLEYSQKIGANLSKSNAQRTIAEWIRKSA
ncbi:MAG TPA: hypothetical protein VFP33_05920 [Gallionella sp.]|nr:hypothetical protein [Gallionella sp.]